MTCETPIVQKYCHISKAIWNKALLSLEQMVQKEHRAHELGVSDATIHRVMQQTNLPCKQTVLSLPKVLCIDEFKVLKSSYSQFNFIYANGETGEILDIVSTRCYKYLFSHFQTYPLQQRSKVRYVVMERNIHYKHWVNHVFPNAEIVVDRFHIVQHINRTLSQLRCQIMKKYLDYSSSEKQKMGRKMKHYGRLLMKYAEALDDKKYTYQRLFKRDMTETMIVNG